MVQNKIHTRMICDYDTQLQQNQVYTRECNQF